MLCLLPQQVMLAVYMALLVAAVLMLGELFIFHVVLISRNLTTYDYIIAQREAQLSGAPPPNASCAALLKQILSCQGCGAHQGRVADVSAQRARVKVGLNPCAACHTSKPQGSPASWQQAGLSTPTKPVGGPNAPTPTPAGNGVHGNNGGSMPETPTAHGMTGGAQNGAGGYTGSPGPVNENAMRISYASSPYSPAAATGTLPGGLLMPAAYVGGAASASPSHAAPAQLATQQQQYGSPQQEVPGVAATWQVAPSFVSQSPTHTQPASHQGMQGGGVECAAAYTQQVQGHPYQGERPSQATGRTVLPPLGSTAGTSSYLGGAVSPHASYEGSLAAAAGYGGTRPMQPVQSPSGSLIFPDMPPVPPGTGSLRSSTQQYGGAMVQQGAAQHQAAGLQLAPPPYAMVGPVGAGGHVAMQ